jgi:hypothetical protein
VHAAAGALLRATLVSLPSGVILAVAIAFYAPTLGWGFTSEDSCHALRAPVTVFDVTADSAVRYSPLGWAYMALLRDPTLLRLSALLLHCLNVILVGTLARQRGLSARAVWLAQLFYAFYPYHYESLFWITASGFYLTVTTCAVGALVLLHKSTKNHSGVAALGACVAGSMAVFFHEQGAMLVPLALLLVGPTGNRKHKFVLGAWLLAALVVFGIKLSAHLGGAQHLGPVPLSAAPVIANVAATVLHGFPPSIFAGLTAQHTLNQSTPLALGVAGLGLLGLGLLRLPGSARRHLLCYLLAASPTFLFSDTIAPRYLCLPAVFLSLAWGAGIARLAKRAKRAGSALLAGGCIGLLALNLQYLAERTQEWGRTARVYSVGVTTLVEGAAALPPRAEPYQIKALDFPARYADAAFSPAFVFRMCFPFAVEQALLAKAPPVRAEVTVVRTRGCTECDADAPAVSSMPAGDLCYGFDWLAGVPRRADCGSPDHSFEFKAALASGYVEQGINEDYAPSNLVDGRLDTEWLAPVGSWVELRLSGRQRISRVRLVNSVNAPHNDYATHDFVVRVFDADREVARREDSFAGYSLEPGWHSVSLPLTEGDRVRVELRSHFGAGGGLSEVQVQ